MLWGMQNVFVCSRRVRVCVACMCEWTRGGPYLWDSLKYWRGMDPHLMLHIFIPALLFGSAFTMDLHLVRKCVTQVLLLAGPGVVFATFSTAGLIYVVLPYGWSFDTCLMAGWVQCKLIIDRLDT